MAYESYKEFITRLSGENADIPDVYGYNTLPVTFRNQAYHVISNIMKRIELPMRIFEILEKDAAEQMGLLMLGGPGDPEGIIYDFIVNNDDHMKVLFLIGYILMLLRLEKSSMMISFERW